MPPENAQSVTGTSADVGLFIGRFQPFHLGHLHAVNYALAHVDVLRLAIGSSNRVNEPENPFSIDERRAMIQNSLDVETQKRITIHTIPDVQHHMRWLQMVQDRVPPFCVIFTNDPTTSQIYRMHGMSVRGIPFHNRSDLSGTNVRRIIADGGSWSDLVPAPTIPIIEAAIERIRTLLQN